MFPQSCFPCRAVGASHDRVLHKTPLRGRGPGRSIPRGVALGTGALAVDIHHCRVVFPTSSVPVQPIAVLREEGAQWGQRVPGIRDPPPSGPGLGERHKSSQAGRFLHSLLLCAPLPM